MKLKNFLNVMNPTRTYKVICEGEVAEFKPDEALPDIIASAELIRCTKDKETGCVVLEIKSEEEEHENH
ncbi:MAG: hypothetical protein ACLUQE_01645 [Dorea formicigenerans]